METGEIRKVSRWTKGNGMIEYERA